jgi:hypothetical protein
VRERLTLQEWPLSCVERVATEDGRKQVYKAQHSPSVEPKFYAQARSRLIISARTVYDVEPYSAMFLEYLEAPTVGQMNWAEPEVLEFGTASLKEIAGMEGLLPLRLDLSSEQKWRDYFGGILRDLQILVQRRIFQVVQPPMIAALERLAFSASVLNAIRAGSGYVHHDLAGDNVFVLPDGPRVIDWQRPILAPAALDLALLLESLGFDPVPRVGEGVFWLMRLLRASWFTECATEWFPEGRGTYDRQIAEIIKQISRE